MFVAGRCSTLVTVGWAWLGSRVCLGGRDRQYVLIFVYLKKKNKKKKNKIISHVIALLPVIQDDHNIHNLHDI
jgi:hypothetical protein